jgi:hypothetical protein
MSKEEWQSLHGTLTVQYKKFSNAYPTVEYGKNKQIREKAKQEVESAIFLAKRYLEINPDAFELIMYRAGPSMQGRAEAYNEFAQPRYFGGEMETLLNKIKSKIEEA